MGYPTSRVMLYDKDCAPLGELAPSEVLGRVRHEKLNGEHTLMLTTTRVLEVGTRILTVDWSGKWREHVVSEPDHSHESGKSAVGEYECMWSLQWDLTTTYSHDFADASPPYDRYEPGMGPHSDTTARNAVDCALDGSDKWTVGTVDVADVEPGKGCVMIGKNAWDRLALVVDAWGGEVDAEISVDLTGVVTRKVALLAHLGSTTVTRRFDWGEDLVGIHRKPDPGPYYCRVVPLGKGQKEYAEDDVTEFDWPLDITEEEPHGLYYIQDDEAAQVFRELNPDGTWHYPTKIVEYSEDDPELLYNAGLKDLHDWTRPKVTYEANVLQLERAGMDVKGVALGDEVQCVDRGFNPEAALRVQGRVTEMEVDELSPKTGTDITIGNTVEDMVGVIEKLTGSAIGSVTKRLADIESGGTIVHVNDLLEHVNAELNAIGGHTYLVPGIGTVTYDRVVSDPAVGAEASYAVQMTGGGMRFSKTKNAGDWVWTNVITPDGYLGLAATIARIETGYIHDAASNLVMDLDAGTLTFKRGLIQSADGRSSWNLTESTFKVVDADVTGKITATSGEIGGFTISSGALYTGDSVTANTSGCVALSSTNFTREIDDVSRSGLRLAIGSRFAVTGNGTLYASNAHVSGTITATSGEIGGLKISGSAIYSGSAVTSSADNAVALSSEDFTRTIDGTQRSGLRFAIGNKLGVTGDGKMYASGVVVSGQIDATSGEIGGFTIGSTSIYNGKQSLQSLTSGVYVSTTGISVGSGSTYTALASGYLYGGATASSTHGYVGFNNRWTPTNTFGVRLAGRGCIALLTNGPLGIGSYYDFGADATITTGQSGTLSYVKSIEASWTLQNLTGVYNVTGLCKDLVLRWVPGEVNFTKGLMTTAI